MADTMNLNIKTVNVTLAFEGNLLALAKDQTSDIRTQLMAAWDGTAEPIVTQLPNLVAFILPQNEFSCVFDHQNRLILSNQALSPFNARESEIDKLIRFLFRLKPLLTSSLKAYGFNYAIECEKDGLGALIKTFFAEEKLQNIKDIVGGTPDFIEAGFMIVYKNATFQTNVRVSPTGLPNRYQIDGNVNYDTSTWPDSAQFSTSFKEGYTQIEKIAKSLE